MNVGVVPSYFKPPHPTPHTRIPHPPGAAGVVQMNVGVILSYFNQRYFADSLSTLCEFIPQVGDCAAGQCVSCCCVSTLQVTVLPGIGGCWRASSSALLQQLSLCSLVPCCALKSAPAVGGRPDRVGETVLWCCVPACLQIRACTACRCPRPSHTSHFCCPTGTFLPKCPCMAAPLLWSLQGSTAAHHRPSAFTAALTGPGRCCSSMSCLATSAPMPPGLAFPAPYLSPASLHPPNS